MNQIIITSQENSYDLCLNELFGALSGVKLVKWLEKGLGVVQVQESFEVVSEFLKNRQMIFLRHIFPLEDCIQINGRSLDTILELSEAISRYMARMSQAKSFTVQVRTERENTVGNQINNIGKYQIEQFITNILIHNGFNLNVEQPCQVISVVVNKNTFYTGLSNAFDNLSSWTGGMRRFAKYEEQISRAEFKLLEAIDVFGLNLSFATNALDLGASPGGWTKVLLDHGLYVTAVDPAILSESLQAHPRVAHTKGLAQEFLRQNADCFDIIVNDMRMDVIESVKIMLEFHHRLTDIGLMIMTFKLPKTNQKAVIKKGLELLRKKYELLHVKQLFHNRSEITVIARNTNPD